MPSTSTRGAGTSPEHSPSSSPPDNLTAARRRKRKRDEVDDELLNALKKNEKSRRRNDRLVTAIQGVLKTHFDVDINLDSSSESN